MEFLSAKLEAMSKEAGETADSRRGSGETQSEGRYSVELDDNLRVYSMRFVICALFCVATFANQIMWVTFVPISNLAADYLGASTLQVNWLSIIWLVLYLPGTYLQAMLLDRYNLRTAVCIGAGMTVVGSLLRVLGASLRFAGGKWAISEGWQYAFQFIGQVIVAIVQPVFLNIPGNVSSAWFPPNERDVSTTFASVSGPIGNAIGSILPSLFVSANDSSREMEGNFLNLLLCEFFIALFAAALVFRYFESRPPTPPSESERMRQKLLEADKVKIEGSLRASASGTHSAVDSHVNDIRSVFSSPPPMPPSDAEDAAGISPGSVWRQMCWLAGNRNYVLLFLAFSIGLGVFNLILTLVNQIMEPYGYSNDEAGYCNFALLITGLVGAAFTSKILETYKAYDTVIKVGFLGSLIAMMILIEGLEAGFELLCFGFALMGFFVLPLLPAVIECCAEITYPYVSEDIAVGAIFVSGNLTGAVFSFVGEVLLENSDGNQTGDNKVSPFAQPSNIFSLLCTALGCGTVFLFRGTYARLGLDYVMDNDDGSPMLRADRPERLESTNTDGGWTFTTLFSSATRTPLSPQREPSRDIYPDYNLERGLLDDEVDTESEASVVPPPGRTATGNYSIASADEAANNSVSVSYANSQRDTIQASHSPVKRALHKLGPMSPAR